jgi:restriction system protein
MRYNMAIPRYDELLEPILLAHSDGKVRTIAEIRESVIPPLGLSEAEFNKMVSSGRVTVIADRIGWAKTSLTKAGLIESTKRGSSRITAEGLALLKSGRTIDLNCLKNYESFRKYRYVSNPKENDVVQDDRGVCDGLTPDESLEASVKDIHDRLVDDLLSEIEDCDPMFFERLVVDLLERIYGGDFVENSELTGGSGDEGIDGVIKQDRLGFNKIYIQAKKWSAGVSRPELQKFAGALQGQGAAKGAFITSSHYSNGAREYVEKISANTRIVLIDGRELARLMIEYGVGVSDRATITIKKLDRDYFHPDGD